MRIVPVLVAGLFCFVAVPQAFADAAMPVAQQNALVQKYCAVCHRDASGRGGLSLEHFDAAEAPPSLAAVMISKLTSGLSLGTVIAAASQPSAAELVRKNMQGGAIQAAGVAAPDPSTIYALITALASRAAAAHEWSVNRTQDPATTAPMLTASILREVPSATHEGEGAMYRLVVACNAATREGEMQLAWAPVPKAGTLSAVVDGNAPVTYTIEGTETMGNGSKAMAGPAAARLFEARPGAATPPIRLPTQALTIRDLFPNETVEFPFGSLPLAARQSLSVCFTGAH